MTNSPTAIPGNIPALVSLLERQLAMYQQLRALSQQQSSLVAEAKPEPLLGLLAQRQKLIDSVSALNTQLDPYRKRWSELWADLGEADRQQVGALVKDVQELLAGIIQQDERDRDALQQAKGRAAAELQRLARAGQAINAYRAAPNAGNGPAVAPNTTGLGTGNNRFTNQKG